MEKVNWKVNGMSCTNCALSIQQFLDNKGLSNVRVNFASGEVSFDINPEVTKPEIASGIQQLGYSVETGDATIQPKKRFLSTHWQRFIFCAIFTVPLLLHMFVHIHFLMDPWFQLALTIPIYIVGMDFFGRSAIRSILRGIPNMNVLIAVGATSAFVYSVLGMFTTNPGNYLFFETTATILTLVFLGNWMEDKSVETTQASLNRLTVDQKIMANMIAFDDQYKEQIFPVESKNLKVGDLLLVRSGEQVPADLKILSGDAEVNEAIITGESLPVFKKMNDKLIGGSILVNGNVKGYVSAVGEESVMNQILRMVKDAQSEKPPVQQLADKISAIFVPVVLGLAALAFLGNYFIGHFSFNESLMRTIAVLVIACPCAMGLATPAAIAVGLGRAAKNGILFRNAKSLEIFKDIRQVVFDKTGTLTTGEFSISSYKILNETDDASFKSIVYSLEKYATHPIAKSLAKNWKTTDEIKWKQVREEKGEGMYAEDKTGNNYAAVSFKAIKNFKAEEGHNVYVLKNNEVIGFIDMVDEIRPEAFEVIQQLRSKNIEPVLLSGDTKEKSEQVAKTLGITKVFAEQSPTDKLKKIEELSNETPTAMIGDGINDAPALAKATVGISISDASQIALQSAQVVLLHHGIKNLPLALGLGKHTFTTIKQNLFWAFFYNVFAIPIAAFGYLSPAFAALAMGFSDVVLAINSIRLRWKKVF
jgi:Cu+-exporting ATPase